MPRRIAIFGVTFVLMAALLWGGCLSCAQYFMLLSAGNQACCHSAGKCGESAPKTHSLAQCQVQPASLSDTTSKVAPSYAAFLPSQFNSVGMLRPVMLSSFEFNLRGSPPPHSPALRSVLRV